MDDHDTPDADPDTLPETVRLRARHDGWTPEKQHRFIEALAESGCVTEACGAVGMSPKSAYRLRTRADASIFRQAWDIALDHAIRRLSDAAFSRAINGVSRPVFYQGEQIGERRHYDERLTMFLLRYRDPVRYGAWLDRYEARRHPDGAGITLAYALNRLSDDAHDYRDPDDSDPDRPLAEGPPRIRSLEDERRDADHEELIADWPEESKEAAREIRRHFEDHRDKPPADPTVDDLRDPLIALRPLTRTGSRRDVP